MPLYNVQHSFPLTMQQKTDLAERMTRLHATAFKTPSMFVQVQFYPQDASVHNHFVGGKNKHQAVNRIMAYVRSSASRKKEHFDKLGEDIENAWYVVLGERLDGEDEEEAKKKKDDGKETSQSEKDAKELLSIAFVGGIIVREKGYAIPEAGEEEAWVKEYRKDFEARAELGDESLKDMLQEIEDRDDLAAWKAK